MRISDWSSDVCSSDLMKDDPRVRETPFGVDTERFRPGLDAAQREPLVIFVGGLDRAHYFKGVPVLIEAFALALKAVPEARLAVALGRASCRERVCQYV